VCFKLHIDVVSPPYLHNFGLELFQVRELRSWYATCGLLSVDMLSTIRESGVVGAPNWV
jgi:hypothetical protein